MLGILIGGRFWDFKCLIWNFLIWKQQNLHIKENDQHLVQLLPNKLVTPFITVLLVSINVFGFSEKVQGEKMLASVPDDGGGCLWMLYLFVMNSPTIPILQLQSLSAHFQMVRTSPSSDEERFSTFEYLYSFSSMATNSDCSENLTFSMQSTPAYIARYGQYNTIS